ncbi:hypothetical protein ACH46F_02940 [Streptomyces virginiae]|uniref:hypothetical protein n=1 Tax=Streptomyces virginiae TaxID=1961 RepID=UPI00378F798F
MVFNGKELTRVPQRVVGEAECAVTHRVPLRVDSRGTTWASGDYTGLVTVIFTAVPPGGPAPRPDATPRAGHSIIIVAHVPTDDFYVAPVDPDHFNRDQDMNDSATGPLLTVDEFFDVGRQNPTTGTRP